jgi:hypothetical protein
MFLSFVLVYVFVLILSLASSYLQLTLGCRICKRMNKDVNLIISITIVNKEIAFPPLLFSFQSAYTSRTSKAKRTSV